MEEDITTTNETVDIEATTVDDTENIYEGTSGEAEIVEVEDVEETPAEPAMWPAYVSFGALGVMVLAIIILNIRGGRK